MKFILLDLRLIWKDPCVDVYSVYLLLIDRIEVFI